MNRKELVSEISERAGITKAVADKALEAFMETVKSEIKRGNDVRLIGFGSFRLGKRSAREGINPQTMKKIKLKAVNIPKFKAGKVFKMLVN